MKSLVLVYVLYFLVNTAEGVVDKKSCPKIPGWTMVYGRVGVDSDGFTAADLANEQSVTEEEARLNSNDMRLRTCCDYKKKCTVRVTALDPGNRAKERCEYEVFCRDVESGTLRLNRKNEGSERRTSVGAYCFAHYSFTSGGNMDYCDWSKECFGKSSSKDDLLPCMYKHFNNQYVNEKSIFSETPFPFKEFSYKESIPEGNRTWTLNQDGSISKPN